MGRHGWAAWVIAILIALGGCKKKEEKPQALELPQSSPATSVKAEEPPAEQPAGGAPSSEVPVAVARVPVAAVPKPDAGAPVAAKGDDAGFKSIMGCCGALGGEAKKPGMNKNRYSAAASVCGGIAQSVKTGKANAAAARTTIRAQLQGVPVPSGC